MKVCIEFNVDNAAFVDDWEGEVEAQLNQVRRALTKHGRPKDGDCFQVIGRLRDINGNRVGCVTVERERERKGEEG